MSDRERPTVRRLDDGQVAGRPRTLSIDIGGSGIKMLVLDEHGSPINERLRRKTPRPALPSAVLRTLERMIARQPDFDRVSVGFPGVVRHGVVRTAANLGTKAWEGQALQAVLQAIVSRPVRVINDADLQGYGVITGDGVELVLTLGTGMGSALFTDGHLVPNVELAHHPFSRGRTYEQCVSKAEYRRVGERRWRKRVRRIIQQLALIWNYDTLFIGGGNARCLSPDLPANVRRFRSEQGLAGGVRLWDEAPASGSSRVGITTPGGSPAGAGGAG